MAGLRIFVSSTCYDLSSIRSQLRTFILNMGYDPIMSDYNDVLYDPRIHTHTSCIEEVSSCDMIILIVGSRFGGRAIPEAISKLDFDELHEKSKSVEILKKRENISVTQLEILKAVEKELPIFTFIENRLWNDHELYEKNKGKEIISKIEFPSIEKPETAGYIFEFVNFLRHRTKGNSINNFSKFDDISDTLKKQLSGLFQRLLSETRNKLFESKRIDVLSEQFDDLKTAILTSIGSSNEKDVARGMVRYRRVVDFLKGLKSINYSIFLKGRTSWEELLHIAEIVNILDSRDVNLRYRRRGLQRSRTILIRKDQTFYELRYPKDVLEDLKLDYEAYINEQEDVRSIIFDALNEMEVPLEYRYRESFVAGNVSSDDKEVTLYSTSIFSEFE